MEIKPIIAPRGGLNLSLPADLISEVEMSDCQNVYFEDGLVKKRRGYKDHGANLPLAGPFIGCDQFYKFDSTNFLIALTTKLAYKRVAAVTTAATKAGVTWDPISDSEEEDDCETTWTDPGANITIADETTIKKADSKSQKITVETAFTTGLIGYRDQSLGDKSAYGFVRFWIRSDTDVAANSLQFCIDDSAGCGSPTETLNIPALTADTWRLCVLECSDPATNMTSIESMGLKVAVDLSTSANVIIYIDDIQFVKSFTSTVAYDTTKEDLFSYDYVRKSNQTDPWWICTNGVDPIKYWTGADYLVNLISSYPSGVTALLAKHVIEFKGYLFLLDVSEDGNRYPQRIRWSDSEDPEDFLNGNASYNDITGADWIMGAMKFKGETLVVFKERSIWVGYPTPDDPTGIFTFKRKTDGTGCAASNTIENLGDEIIFLGWDDVYVFNGIDYESLTEKNVGISVINSIDPAQIGKCFGVVLEEQKEYWLFYPSTGSNYCDGVWCFNYNLNRWTKHSVADYISMYGYFQLEASVTIADLVGTIAQQTWRIGDRTSLASMPVTLFGDTDGNVYEYDPTLNNDDDTAIDGYFCTKDFNPTQFMQQFLVTRLDVYYSGDTLQVWYSTDKGANYTLAATITSSASLDVVNRVWLRLDTNQIRFKFRNAVSGEHFEFSRANMYWQPSGGRLA